MKADGTAMHVDLESHYASSMAELKAMLGLDTLDRDYYCRNGYGLPNLVKS